MNSFFNQGLSGLVYLEQRTQAWHDWRDGKDLGGTPRITATMAAVIAGDSVSNKTPHLLWQELTGRREPAPVSEFAQRAMARGVKLEPAARQAYTEQTSNVVMEICVQHPDHPWAAASLDGLTASGDIVLELKCPTSQRVHNLAKSGEVPTYYVAQLQWQLLCTPSAKEAHYASYFEEDEDGESMVVVVVKRDPVFLAWLFDQALNFRLALLEDRPPAHDSWLIAARQYRLAKAELDAAQSRLSDCETALLAAMPEGSDLQDGAGVRVSRFRVRGAVNYEGLLATLSTDPAAIQAAVEASRPPGQPDFAKAAMLLGGLSAEQVAQLEDRFRAEGAMRHRITCAKDYDPSAEPPVAPVAQTDASEEVASSDWSW
jgi:putative phage-type endonuclease